LLSQTTLYNSGVIEVLTNTTIYNQGHVYLANGSTINNNGTLSLEQDWINNSGASGLNSTGTGSVNLLGADQEIKGSNTTRFYTLNLLGTATKFALIDTEIAEQLNINNAVLETNDKKVSLTNPAPTSLSWNNGFISSELLGGYFVRATNSTQSYSFPVGSISQSSNYRAVDITPVNNLPNTYGVRYAHVNPDFDDGISASGDMAPYYTSSKAIGVEAVNNQYYHNIYRFSGNSPAHVKLYYFDYDTPLEIGGVAQWNGAALKWKDAGFAVQAASGASSVYGSPTAVAQGVVQDFSHDAFALIENDMVTLVDGISPNGDGKNDVFIIPGIENYPDNKLVIYNRWGQEVFSAAPYENDWGGQRKGSYGLWGEELPEDTYFYILTLDKNSKPVSNYIELIRD